MVEVVYALPERQRVVVLELPEGGLTAGEALARSGLLQELPALADPTTAPVVLGVWGSVCEPTRALCDGDRVEVYRPLRNDPRIARRARVATPRGRRGR